MTFQQYTKHNKFRLNNCEFFLRLVLFCGSIFFPLKLRAAGPFQWTDKRKRERKKGCDKSQREKKKHNFFKLITYFVSASGCLKYKHLNTQLFEIYMNILHAFDTWMEFHTFRSSNNRQRRKQEQHTHFFLKNPLIQFWTIFFNVFSAKERREKKRLENYN